MRGRSQSRIPTDGSEGTDIRYSRTVCRKFGNFGRADQVPISRSAVQGWTAFTLFGSALRRFSLRLLLALSDPRRGSEGRGGTRFMVGDERSKANHMGVLTVRSEIAAPV